MPEKKYDLSISVYECSINELRAIRENVMEATSLTTDVSFTVDEKKEEDS